MGKGSAKIEVTEYFMSLHFGICAQADALTKIIVKEKVAWQGEQAAEGAISITLPDLFGGIKKEGGLLGTAYYLPGDASQVMPDALAVKLGRADGTDCPGFRGLASVFFYGSSPAGFYWTANTPYLPGVWVTVRRAPVGLDPAYALIGNGSTIAGEVVLQWRQNTFVQTGGNDEARMGIGFLDDNGALIGSIEWSSWAQPSDWTLRSLSATAPSGAKRIRVYMGMQRLAGTHCDGYIDSIELTMNGQAVFLQNAGAESGTAGWTATTGGLDAWNDILGLPGTPEPYSGAYYFAGGNHAATQAHQDTTSGQDANPAHIIYECLTNTDWGMGSPLAAIDYDVFDAVSQVLYAEGFGLSMIWTRQSSIQDFIQEILDHIQAVIYVDPSTGLLTIALIRGDYDADTLDILTPDNSDLTSFSRKLWGDITNEIVVTWTNPDNEQEETITVQDDSSIATQGGSIISDSRNYYGVRSAGLAQALAMRDLRSAGQPLASVEAEVDRSQYALRPASVIKVTWPEYGVSELVMRVQSVDYGKPGDPTIKLSLIEDVYGLDIGSYDDPPGSSWTDPSAPPAPLDEVEIFTLPYFFALGTTVAAFVDSPEYPEVIAGVLATDDSSDTYAYELWDEVTLPNGSTEWQSITTNNIIGRAELGIALDPEVATANVTFDNLIGKTSPTVAGFVIIGEDGEAGNEIAMIDSEAGGDYDLVRGILDTIPRAWPIGTKVWFVDSETLFEDTEIRSGGEAVSYKLLSRTSIGLLALADAPLESATLSDRPWLPNRPANVIAYGEAWSNPVDGWIDATARPDPWVTVDWAIRNRLDEDALILAWDDASGTAEPGQTTTIEVRALDDTLLATHDGLTGTTFDVPDASFGSEALVELRVYSERSDDDGDFVSLQYFSHWVQVAPITADTTIITADTTAWTADEG